MFKSLANKLANPIYKVPSIDLTDAPNKTAVFYICLLVGIANLAHFLIAHPIIGVWSSFIFLINIFLLKRNAPLLPRFLIVTFTIVSIFLIIVFYGGWSGEEAGISFLVLLVTLKLLEAKSRRDYYIICLILYFLASASFLVNSSLLSIVLITLYCSFTLASQAALTNVSLPSQKTTPYIKTAWQLLLKAMPIAVILFILFPRLHTDLGLLNNRGGNTGGNQLNDHLSPGDFASSANNHKLAFRVEFKDTPPKRQDLYWRVKTFSIEDDFKWKILPRIELGEQPNKYNQVGSPNKHHYSILHQASNDNFIPYLDWVIQPSLGQTRKDQSISRIKQNNHDFQYSGVSIASTKKYQVLNQTEKAHFLQMSYAPSPAVKQLLKHWQTTSNTPNELINDIIRYFKTEPFHYSLTPPKLGASALDTFLFQTKTGYCEHYASAFTSLARWAGIPARVAVGYQGGEYNQSGNYYEVLYSDAHAWSEVWIDNQWVRIDPTATVSPERINLGLLSLLDHWNGESFDFSDTYFHLSDILKPQKWSSTFKVLKNSWDNVSYQWTKWVINYDFEQQKKLLRSIGFKNNVTLILLSLLFIGVGIVLFFLFFIRSNKKPTLNPEVKLYQKFTKKFKRFGLNKQLPETPYEFSQRAITKLPHLKKEIETITNHYIKIRYTEKKTDIRYFKHLIKQFKITGN